MYADEIILDFQLRCGLELVMQSTIVFHDFGGEEKHSKSYVQLAILYSSSHQKKINVLLLFLGSGVSTTEENATPHK